MAILGQERGIGIDEVAARAGVSERLVGHCEALGLISRAREGDASRPGYKREDICVLRFVRQAHVLGFGMSEAAKLLSVWQGMGRVGSEFAGTTSAGSINQGACIDGIDTMTDFVERMASLIPVELEPGCSILEEMLELGARSALVGDR
ncbi:hypothetical protein CSQ96_18540 [Janthinobacterium sp. BJB412]|nr:hypothetical protein CSQ96_18540 [Janthinobacterium sp. BJB412]